MRMEEIDDPLYGNMGGPEELFQGLLQELHEDIRASCDGLMQTILEIKASLQDSETLKQGVRKSLGEMESLDWLVPQYYGRQRLFSTDQCSKPALVTTLPSKGVKFLSSSRKLASICA